VSDGETRAFGKLGSSSGNNPDLEGPAQRSTPARIGLLIARIGIAAIATRFALGKDPGEALRTLTDARAGWVAAAFGAMLGMVGLSALRWRSYLHAIGHIDVSRVTALRLTIVGGFFNAFLPTGVGGDAYKAMRVAPKGRRSESFASVLLDRFSGLVGIAVVTAAAIALDLEETPKRLLFVSEAIAVAIITATVVPRASREWVLRRAHIQDRGPVGHALWRAVGAVAQANRSLRVAGVGYLWGIATQVMLLFVHVCIARALDIDLPLGILAAAAIVAQIAALVPLTINGLGFRESAYVWALGTAGIDPHLGAAFALGILGQLLAVSALGGLVYLVSPYRTPPRNS
jgi:glycosyltransferase 2 family protein